MDSNLYSPDALAARIMDRLRENPDVWQRINIGDVKLQDAIRQTIVLVLLEVGRSRHHV